MSRPSAGKTDREQARKAKAEAKRKRRLAPRGDNSAGAMASTVVADDGLSAPDLLRKIEEIHHLREAREISDEEFLTLKTRLLAQLPVD